MARPERPPLQNGPLWAQAIATLLGLGYSPRMPGTLGSAVGLFLYLPAFLMPAEWSWLLALGETILFCALTLLAVPPVLRASGKADPGFVIVDEVAGMLTALTFLEPDFTYLLVAFALFRLLDILKPYPVNRLERLPGALGVLADDLAAGALAGVLSILVMRLA
ncbi:MAG: phosphatidylglycerophosphatase A [Acidobacteriota bacterium]